MDVPRVIVIPIEGYSFTLVKYTIYGAFKDRESALDALRKEYYLDCDLEDI